MKANQIVVIFLFICSLSSKATNQLYIYIDQFGNKKYSNVPPNTKKYLIKELPSISTVEWHKPNLIEKNSTKKPTIKNNAKTRMVKSERSSKQLCFDESKKIKKLENKLKQKLKIHLFDEIKENLRKLRWHYQKSC